MNRGSLLKKKLNYSQPQTYFAIVTAMTLTFCNDRSVIFVYAYYLFKKLRYKMLGK